ncbi:MULTISPECIES: CPBP family glutamic-type intramembrane protease [unclassified Saccharicrinis]|uniref:CPBP family glutamic-type intramembrane protease n=1 Tax=unclassified Saccharicrinis TaxID=2646859 RepID=UPI003D355699
MKLSDQRCLFEMMAVVFTGIGKYIFMDWLEVRLAYMTVACAFWVGYIAFRSFQNRNVLSYWGLTGKRFKKSFLEFLPFAVMVVVIFIVAGTYLGTSVLSWHIFPILLLYPIWGIIQQFVMIGIFARNLKQIGDYNIPDWVIILVTALTFSVVHLPSVLLVIATFFLALIYTTLYLKNRNLIVMGIFHGWLGAFFFYTLLHRDSWKEVFGVLGI